MRVFSKLLGNPCRSCHIAIWNELAHQKMICRHPGSRLGFSKKPPGPVGMVRCRVCHLKIHSESARGHMKTHNFEGGSHLFPWKFPSVPNIPGMIGGRTSDTWLVNLVTLAQALFCIVVTLEDSADTTGQLALGATWLLRTMASEIRKRSTRKWDFHVKSTGGEATKKTYPLVIKHGNGKSSINDGPFSIPMLD